ncbi:MAG: tRNA (uridine(34)/cytosine(34)/5-carboxymethylaminomethyluridine(34)-2'-O)-methyltransferase TrmL [Acidobacteriia bacterium]|nr:tRNA (uridine(34)/cytosine(34)/5-carboxymethylaminomethyluridine(34)-2'-O)-methyltransferase TrmL [Terriglobia bacterium]
MHIVLVEPQIPQNTGNIARLCAATSCDLHLVKPLGFETSDYYLRRAGLDYWDKVHIVFHESFELFWADGEDKRCWFGSTKAAMPYTRAQFQSEDYLIFGNETRGLPESFITSHKEIGLTIPMWNDSRSLNLSNAVAIILYEALRQVRGF